MPRRFKVPPGGWLSADELARRAELDGRPAVPEAFDPDCLVCQAMRRACAGHVLLWQRPELREVAAELVEACGACEGSGQVFDELARRWRACVVCNGCPVFPGMQPGGLAERAYRRALAQGDRAGARGARRRRSLCRGARAGEL